MAMQLAPEQTRHLEGAMRNDVAAHRYSVSRAGGGRISKGGECEIWADFDLLQLGLHYSLNTTTRARSDR
jgi:hypothetical protein